MSEPRDGQNMLHVFIHDIQSIAIYSIFSTLTFEIFALIGFGGFWVNIAIFLLFFWFMQNREMAELVHLVPFRRSLNNWLRLSAMILAYEISLFVLHQGVRKLHKYESIEFFKYHSTFTKWLFELIDEYFSMVGSMALLRIGAFAWRAFFDLFDFFTDFYRFLIRLYLAFRKGRPGRDD